MSQPRRGWKKINGRTCGSPGMNNRLSVYAEASARARFQVTKPLLLGGSFGTLCGAVCVCRTASSLRRLTPAISRDRERKPAEGKMNISPDNYVNYSNEICCMYISAKILVTIPARARIIEYERFIRCEVKISIIHVCVCVRVHTHTHRVNTSNKIHFDYSVCRNKIELFELFQLAERARRSARNRSGERTLRLCARD